MRGGRSPQPGYRAASLIGRSTGREHGKSAPGGPVAVPGPRGVSREHARSDPRRGGCDGRPTMNRIGIMEGRLVPPVEGRIQCFPRERWAEEFALAAIANLDCIEWIYDQYGADANPIATDDGINEILRLSDLHG